MTQRYMFVHCVICHGLHACDRHCHVCGCMTVEDSQGHIAYVDVAKLPNVLLMARPKKSLMSAIRKASRAIGHA